MAQADPAPPIFDRVGAGRKGVVTLPHGWHEANAAYLTDSREVDPLTTQPQMSAIPVSIAPVAQAVLTDS